MTSSKFSWSFAYIGWSAFICAVPTSIAFAADAPPAQHKHVIDHSDDPQHEYERDPTFKAANWDNVPTIDLKGFSNPSAGWKLTPDGVVRAKTSLDIALKARDARQNQRPEFIHIARQAPYAFVVYTRVNNPPEVRVELIDLAGGVSTGSFVLPHDSKLADVSPDGKSVLIHGEDKRGRLEFWTINAQRTDAVRSLITFPYSGEERDKDVNWAAYTDSGHVAILNGGKLAMFDIATVKVRWNALIEGNYAPKISPGGKYVLIRTRDVEIPVVVDGNYDMEVKMTRDRGHKEVVFVFPAGAPAELGFAGMSGHSSTLFGKPPVRVESPVPANNAEMTLNFHVISGAGRTDISVTLNGAPYIHWIGETSALHADAKYASPDASHVAIRVHKLSAVTFHSIRVTMLSGSK